MRKISTYLGSILIMMSVFYCCKTNNQPQKIKIDFNSLVSAEVDNFTFDDIELKNNNWEYVYIVEPYARIDSIPVSMDKRTLNEIKHKSLYDNNYFVLFYNADRELLFYALITGSVVNLKDIVNKEYGRTKIFSIVGEGNFRKVQE